MSTRKTEQPLKQTAEKTIEQAAEKTTRLYAAMMDQTIRVNRIAAKGIGRTIEEQLGLFETAVESTRPLASARQPGEVLAVQVDAWKAFSEKLVATTRNLVEIQRETGTELKDVVVDGLRIVNETVPKAA